jgi:hypothetical protein
LPLEQVVGIIVEHLMKEGQTEQEALQIIEAQQKKIQD